MRVPLSARAELHTIALVECIAKDWEMVHPGPCHCEYCCYQVKFYAALMAAAVPVVSPLLEVPR